MRLGLGLSSSFSSWTSLVICLWSLQDSKSELTPSIKIRFDLDHVCFVYVHLWIQSREYMIPITRKEIQKQNKKQRKVISNRLVKLDSV